MIGIALTEPVAVEHVVADRIARALPVPVVGPVQSGDTLAGCLVRVEDVVPYCIIASAGAIVQESILAAVTGDAVILCKIF